MNDYGRGPVGGNEPPRGGGSVRRARERMEAGLPPELPSANAGYEQRSKAPSPLNQSRRQVQPEPLGSSIGENAIGVAISRPIPAPQWPLMDQKTAPTQQFVSDPAYRPPPGRSVAPQRPPRPSRVPSILDSSQPQEHVPTFAYNNQSNRKPPPIPQYPDEDLFSPGNNNPKSPETPSGSSGSGSGSESRPSTMSSVGTIPDFPLPILGPRRSGNLGPPPSSRRGASSYYSSHASYVSPIPEESPRTARTQLSHSSYASSAAIPSSWGSESPGYYNDGEQSPRENGDIMSEHGIIEEGRESRESNYDNNEEQSLVRQASVGKRGKPSLINTKSVENIEAAYKPEPSAQPEDNQPKENQTASGLWGLRKSVAPEAAVAAAIAAGFATEGQAGARETIWPSGTNANPPAMPNMPSDLAATRGPTPASTSSEWTSPTTASSETMPTVGRALSSSERMSYRQSRQPVPPIPLRSDARMSRILGAHEAASAIDPSDAAPEKRFSRLSAIRRPPRLDINAVRDAEARGSLTSLPDLIKRATRLASMMEKGRRPASRFDWQTSPGGKSVIGMDRYGGPTNEDKHQTSGQVSGIGDMLAAFPAPGVATPTREVESARSPRPAASRSPRFRDEKSSFDDGAQEPQPRKRQRRCCGVPLCGFVIIIIILLLAIVAGIVVPIELLVVHKPSSKDVSPSTQLTLASCIAEVTCLNGGKNDISSGVCSCICVNGFTGATCASDTDTVGCTTADIGGTSAVNNVTLGASLPRLIAQAESNFTIPLTSTIILSRLNTANLSCVSENSLVTLNGASDRTATSTSSGAVLPVVQNANFAQLNSAGVEVTLTVSGGGSGAAAVETIALAGSKSVTVELGSTNTAAAAAATTDSSVTVSLGGTSSASPSVTVSLGSTTLQPTTTASTTTASTSATNSAAPSPPSFTASQEMLDFARIAILYVLQQENLSNAATAQTDIQSFLSSSGASNAAAQNISIGNGNTLDLVNFAVDVGNGTIGALTSTASKRRRRYSHPLPYRYNQVF